MATQYDPGILQQYADELYRQAWDILFITAVQYGFVAFALGWLLANAGLRPGGVDTSTMNIIVTAIGIVFGVSAGRRKAFAFKLQAQQILCQRQIEFNTRQQTVAASVS